MKKFVQVNSEAQNLVDYYNLDEDEMKMIEKFLDEKCFPHFDSPGIARRNIYDAFGTQPEYFCFTSEVFDKAYGSWEMLRSIDSNLGLGLERGNEPMVNVTDNKGNFATYQLRESENSVEVRRIRKKQNHNNSGSLYVSLNKSGTSLPETLGMTVDEASRTVSNIMTNALKELARDAIMCGRQREILVNFADGIDRETLCKQFPKHVLLEKCLEISNNAQEQILITDIVGSFYSADNTTSSVYALSKDQLIEAAESAPREVLIEAKKEIDRILNS